MPRAVGLTPWTVNVSPSAVALSIWKSNCVVNSVTSTGVLVKTLDTSPVPPLVSCSCWPTSCPLPFRWRIVPEPANPLGKLILGVVTLTLSVAFELAPAVAVSDSVPEAAAEIVAAHGVSDAAGGRQIDASIVNFCGAAGGETRSAAGAHRRVRHASKITGKIVDNRNAGRCRRRGVGNHDRVGNRLARGGAAEGIGDADPPRLSEMLTVTPDNIRRS